MRKRVGPTSAVPKDDKEDRFTGFVYVVFVAVVLGSGGVIWSLVAANATLDKRVTVLEFKCVAPLLSVPPVPAGH